MESDEHEGEINVIGVLIEDGINRLWDEKRGERMKGRWTVDG